MSNGIPSAILIRKLAPRRQLSSLDSFTGITP